MKKYIPCGTKWFAILTIISSAMLLTGIVFIVTNSFDVGVQFGLTIFGGLMSILFLCCYFAAKSRVLIIDSDKIIFICYFGLFL